MMPCKEEPLLLQNVHVSWKLHVQWQRSYCWNYRYIILDPPCVGQATSQWPGSNRKAGKCFISNLANGSL